MDFIQRTINNRPISVSVNSTVLQACEAAGVTVPRFCYHEKLSVAGNCRRCLVEVQKSPKPVVSCAMPVSKGMVVFTNTPLARKARESVLEFLLLNHPLDCPICDQGGECDLQDEALTYGSDRGRYFEFKRSVEDKECGPIVKTIRTRCIHCTRCVRFSSEIAGNEVMGAFGRGEETEIGTYVHSFLKTELSGNLVDLCPVGALTSKPYAYKARSWELQQTSTVDFFDARTTDIIVHTRNATTSKYVNSKAVVQSKESIRRILPNTESIYAENWISDRTRYAFDGLATSRITTPFNSLTQLNSFESFCWEDITSFNQQNLKFIVGSQANLEMVYGLSNYSKIFGYANSFNQTRYSAKLLLDIPFFYSLNQAVSEFSKNTINGFIIIGTNLRYEASLLNTMFRREQSRRGVSFVSVGAFSPLRYAHSHQGNSHRIVISSIENRLLYIKNYIKNGNSVGILMGVNTLRGHSSTFLQQLVRQLGKYFFVKTGKEDRLGYVHSTVGSIAFAHFGLNTKKTSEKNITLFSVGACNVTKKPIFNDITTFDQVIAFDTHYEMTEKAGDRTKVLPINSLYESNGHVRSIEGRLRKHNKVVTSPNYVYNLETYLTFYITKNPSSYYFWSKSLSRFTIENPVESIIETPLPTFFFNPFAVKGFFSNCGKLILFSQPVKDFYLQEPIANSSTIRAESALFLNAETNFNRER